MRDPQPLLSIRGVSSVLLLLLLVELRAAGASAPIDYDFAAMLQPVPATARFADPEYNIWCGSAVKGDDGRYHLFYSRWPRALGHKAWVTHSEVAHAVSDSPFGPWQPRDVALPPRGTNYWDGSCTHNPTVVRIGGKFYLYYMGNFGDGVARAPLNWDHRNRQRIGVAVAETLNGPWQRFDEPVLTVSADGSAPDALVVNNPSVAERPGGGVLMIYKAVGLKRPLPFGGPVVHLVATADSPIGPFTKQPGEVFGAKGVMFAAEDPFIWRGADRYWAIVKDNAGHFTQRGYSLALWESADGMDWKLGKHPLVATPEMTWADGRKQTLDALERPQLLFDDGQPIALLCAAADAKGRDGSFNVQIPLKPLAGSASDTRATSAGATSSPASLPINWARLRNPVWTSPDNLRDPSVLQVPDGYLLFYSRLSGTNWASPDSWSVASAFTRDFVRFENDRNLSPKGHASPGDIVKWHGRFVLPYQTYPAAPTQLCLSESTDLQEWSAPRPFLTEARFLPWNTLRRVIDPTLVVHGDTLHCYFVGSAHVTNASGRILRANLLGHALTRDPKLEQWDIRSTDAPLLGVSERAPDGVENVMIFRTGDRWTMIYSEGLADQHLALATSTDLCAWKLEGPIALPRQTWMARKYGAPFVWREAGQWVMILMGQSATGKTTFGLLTSLNGRDWNPLPE
jgi:predicted GH43/DUF377 family glycosyl hydrolase